MVELAVWLLFIILLTSNSVNILHVVLPDCGTLPDPPNGMVTLSGTVQGSSAIYSCNNGFEFSPIPDSTTRTCLESGAWNFVEPTCESKS